MLRRVSMLICIVLAVGASPTAVGWLFSADGRLDFSFILFCLRSFQVVFLGLAAALYWSASTVGHIFRLSLVNGVIFSMALLLIEVFFGNWFIEDNLNILSIPRNQDATYQVSQLYPREEPVHYLTDEHGFRGAYSDISQIDILTLGGSTTVQLFIDEEETWQAVLRREFAEAGTPLSIVNAGIDGHSTYGHVQAFPLWLDKIPGFHARYILFYIGVNDLYQLGDTGYQTFGAMARIPLDSARWMGYLGERSALMHLFTTVRNTFRAHQADLAYEGNSFQRESVTWTEHSLLQASDHDRLTEDLVALYQARVRELIRLTRARGAEPIIVTQRVAVYRSNGGRIEGSAKLARFGEETINGVDLYQLMWRLCEAAVTAAQAENAIVIDLGRELEFGEGDFYDLAHNTPAGAHKLGLYLFQELAPRLK